MTLRARLRRIAPLYRFWQTLRFAGFRWKLMRTTRRDRRLTLAPGALPLPPARLRYRVHGDLDRDSFLATGRTVAADIEAILARSGHLLAQCEDILDFGCGCGRVLRHLATPAGRARLYGADIDAEAIGWCANAIGGVSWKTTAPLPPLPWAAASFDCVFSISVFTHLDEPMQRAWLDELQRVTRPGGVLLLSVHGPFVHGTLPAEAQQRLQQGGFLYTVGATGRLKLDGLPDFYQTAYHTRAYIDREWGARFEILDYVPRGINAHQDAVLLRRR